LQVQHHLKLREIGALRKMADGFSSHQFSVLNKTTLVGNFVVQVHGIGVGLVREPPNSAAALRPVSATIMKARN
jgi:hypothetical protein